MQEEQVYIIEYKFKGEDTPHFKKFYLNINAYVFLSDFKSILGTFVPIVSPRFLNFVYHIDKKFTQYIVLIYVNFIKLEDCYE